MISLTLPWPPSVNSYWRTVNGRTMISKRGRLYKQAVARCVQLSKGNKHLRSRLSLTIDAFPPDRRRRDLDNLVKAVSDALEDAGVFVDDSQIDHLTVNRNEVVKGGFVVVGIAELAQSIRL